MASGLIARHRTARFESTPFHLDIIKRAVYILSAFSASFTDWERLMCAALNLLTKGYCHHPQEITPVFFTSYDELCVVQTEWMEYEKAAWESEGSPSLDARFVLLLEYYSFMYDRIYPTILVPFATAQSTLSGRNPTEYIGDDGRMKIRNIKRLEEQYGFSDGFLRQGVNRHLRNSFAHRRYEVVNRHNIKMEDRTAQGQLSWGPFVFSHEDLKRQVFSLTHTCEAFVVAIMMFEMNNGHEIAERGLLPLPISRPRFDALEGTLGDCALKLGFSLESATVENQDTLILVLKVLGQAKLDRTEMVQDARGRKRKFLLRTQTKVFPIKEQALKFIQLTTEGHEPYNNLEIHVLRGDGTELGTIMADSESRAKMLKDGLAANETIERLTKNFILDETMRVITRHVKEI